MLRELTARSPGCAGKIFNSWFSTGGRTGTPASFSNFCGINALTVATLSYKVSPLNGLGKRRAGAHPYVHYIPDLTKVQLTIFQRYDGAKAIRIQWKLYLEF